MDSHTGAASSGIERRADAISGSPMPDSYDDHGPEAAAFWRRHGADLLALLLLLVIAIFLFWVQVRINPRALRGDVVTQFMPLYTLVSERFWSGDLPGWNPALFSGMPLAADPIAGWGYLPVFLFFSLLTPLSAYQAHLFFHIALGGFATFFLGRRLGLTTLGAVAAALAYQLGPASEYTVCCGHRTQLSPWIPLGMLAVEMGLRARSWRARILWWGGTGFVLSQMTAVWFGKGTYYGFLAIAAFAVYRTLIDPPEPRDFRGRLTTTATHGAGIAAFVAGLSAVTMLPRLEFMRRTNLAGGDYANFDPWQAESDWLSLGQALASVITLDNRSYGAGAVVISLAVAGVVLAGRRFAAPFFLLFPLAVFALTLKPNAVHSLFYLLPRFEVIHEHVMLRILVVFNIGPAILTGAAVTIIQRRETTPHRLLAASMAILFTAATAMILTDRAGALFGHGTRQTMVEVALILAATAFCWMLLRNRSQRSTILLSRVVAGALLLAIVWNLGQGRLEMARDNGLSVPPVTGTRPTLADREDAGGAGEFIRAATATEPARFLGYDALYLSGMLHRERYYRNFPGRPAVAVLLVNNRAVLLGLEDAQGFNPVHYMRYMEYIDAMNSQTQKYHETNLLPSGIGSPLLDLLNVRYIVVPRDVPPGRPDLLRLSQLHPTVYLNDDVRVLENRSALPRAWVVHDMRQVEKDMVLPLLTSGEIDPRQTVLIEGEPPAVAPADPSATGEVRFERYEADRVTLTTSTTADGMLVLADIHDPGWRAYIDGERTDMVIANYMFRAIPLPAGEHTIEFRYEPLALRAGAALWLLSVTALATVAFSPVASRKIRTRRVTNPVTDR